MSASVPERGEIEPQSPHTEPCPSNAEPRPGDTEPRPPSVERFVRELDEAWRIASYAQLAERVSPLFSPGARLSQPLAPDGRGLGGFKRALAGLITLAPDLRGRVVGWAADRQLLYVEFELAGTIGRRRLQLRTCDRIVLRDGIAVERHVFMNPLPLLVAILAQPAVWPRAVRAGLRMRR